MFLLTGATGFIGSRLKTVLKDNCRSVLRGARVNSVNEYFIESLNGETDWGGAFQKISCVVHLAALAHSPKSSPEQFIETNVKGTLRFASEAAKSGVKRFVFLSSIGVNGVSNSRPFKHSDEANPTEHYAISKYEAEIGLKKIAEETGMEVVIIRPPLVYGKNAPGNFGTLLKVAEKNLPLPLGAINNQRSFVYVDNLIDLIITCIEYPDAANQTFLVSDDENISTSNLLKKLTLAAGKKPWLLPIPVSFLKFLAAMVGKKEAVERFSSSLTVDIEHTKKTLNWKPPITLDEGIRRCFK